MKANMSHQCHLGLPLGILGNGKIEDRKNRSRRHQLTQAETERTQTPRDLVSSHHPTSCSYAYLPTCKAILHVFHPPSLSPISTLVNNSVIHTISAPATVVITGTPIHSASQFLILIPRVFATRPLIGICSLCRQNSGRCPH